MLREILLRLPPQPSSLPRASAVCKRWRGLAMDPKFIARFRAHHRKPPLLGIFEHRDVNIVFTPVLDPPDRIPPRRFDLRIRDGRSFLGAKLLGCRHGRVLVIDEVQKEAVVCDPVTGEQLRVPVPPGFEIFCLNGAVVCAAGDQGHVHGRCPFKVVLVFMGSSDGRPLARVYSSETGMWGDLISSQVPSPACFGGSASSLIGNVLYWPFKLGMDNILEFDLDKERLDVIKGPPGMDDSQLHQIIQTEDGVLGMAIFFRYSIQVFQRKANSQGVTMWLFLKMIETYNMIGFPPKIMRKRRWLDKFLGFDEDTHSIYLYVLGSVYMLELKSLHIKKLYETSYSNAKHCHPFTSFYTPGTTITGGGTEILHEG
ncbi:unnamed protein product [Alopecurus aequalis]